MRTTHNIVLDPTDGVVRRGLRTVRLAPIDVRLLELLMSKPGVALTRRQIMHALWGEAAHIDERSVDTHISRLRRALIRGLEDDPITTVRKSGYCFGRSATARIEARDSQAPEPVKGLDLVGNRFGRLMVVSRATEVASGGQLLWNCRCDCGQRAVVRGYYLRSGHTRSCGCYRIDRSVETKTRHGHASSLRGHSPTYQAHRKLLRDRGARLASAKAPQVRVCDRWLLGENGRTPFECFLDDMGERPLRTILSQIAPDLGYEPGNCIWSKPSSKKR